MNKQPKPFKVNPKDMAKLNSQAPLDGLHRVLLAKDPGWVGYVRPDGTGLALFEPSHFEMMKLRLLMKTANESSPDTSLPPPDENCLWGV